MTQKELIKQMALEMDLPQWVAEKALGAFLKVITEALLKDDYVKIKGFGKWFVKKRKGREYRLPNGKKTPYISSFKAPAFTFGKDIKEIIKKGKFGNDEEEF